MRILTLLAVCAFATAPALAADPSSGEAASTATAPAAKPAKAKKVCRETFVKTGSRMGGGRKCKTAEEWAELDGGKKDVGVQESQVGAISRTNR